MSAFRLSCFRLLLFAFVGFREVLLKQIPALNKLLLKVDRILCYKRVIGLTIVVFH